MDDSLIVDLYLSRDEAAIKESKEKYGRRLISLSNGIVGDPQTAEECENDTYLEAWQSIPPNEPREYLYPYLARITRHISLNRCRDRSRLKRQAHICELSAEMEECIPDPNDSFIASDEALSEALNGFLKRLNSEKRNIFIRRYWYADSISAISESFGLSEAKVKTTLFRCRRQLYEHLRREGITI